MEYFGDAQGGAQPGIRDGRHYFFFSLSFARFPASLAG